MESEEHDGHPVPSRGLTKHGGHVLVAGKVPGSHSARGLVVGSRSNLLFCRLCMYDPNLQYSETIL